MTSYEGFGANTVGGKDGKAVKVTCLSDSGPGSLREACASTGRRKIEFSVGGVIRLESDLVIESPYITLDGETAPAPGITLVGRGISIRASEVIVRHMRTRPGRTGGSPDTRDGIAIYLTCKAKSGIRNVVIDQCSATWATDENIQLWNENTTYAIENVTISNCLIAQGLHEAEHRYGPHSMGLLIGPGAKGVSVLRNVFASNDKRNPRIDGRTKVEVIGNVIFNPGRKAIEIQNSNAHGSPTKAQIMRNHYVPGRDTSAKPVFIDNLAVGSQLFCCGNVPDWAFGDCDPNSGSPPLRPERDSSPCEPLWEIWRTDYDEWTESATLAGAGANKPRDDIDRSIIAGVANRNGRIISCPPVLDYDDTAFPCED